MEKLQLQLYFSNLFAPQKHAERSLRFAALPPTGYLLVRGAVTPPCLSESGLTKLRVCLCRDLFGVCHETFMTHFDDFSSNGPGMGMVLAEPCTPTQATMLCSLTNYDRQAF
eukprot:1133770-Amphidinium_carterae.1